MTSSERDEITLFHVAPTSFRIKSGSKIETFVTKLGLRHSLIRY